MQTVKIPLNDPSPTILAQANHVLGSGGVVIHPTDTAYGLAVNVFDPTAVDKIYQIKNRDLSKGLIVCVRDLAMAQELVEFTKPALKLFTTFLPGALTLVLPKKPLVSEKVTGGNPSLAIRIPNCTVTLGLSKLCQFPYSTTSANISGQANPYSLEAILNQFSPEKLALIDLLLDAGPLPEVAPSTIVDLTTQTPKILRQGLISELELFSVLKQP